MQNKSIFVAVAVLLFIVSGVIGYFGPPWFRAIRINQEKEAFVPAGVPKSTEEAFGRQFNNLQRASEPKRLPDDAFLDKKGQKIRMVDFGGKPTLVNLWATWCTPCVVEMPLLDKFAEHYRDQLNVVAIALEQKTPAEIGAFLEKRQLGNLAVFVDGSGNFGKNLGIRGIPTSFLIGSDGLILYRFEGEADWTSPESQEFFDIFLLQKR